MSCCAPCDDATRASATATPLAVLHVDSTIEGVRYWLAAVLCAPCRGVDSEGRS